MRSNCSGTAAPSVRPDRPSDGAEGHRLASRVAVRYGYEPLPRSAGASPPTRFVEQAGLDAQRRHRAPFAESAKIRTQEDGIWAGGQIDSWLDGRRQRSLETAIMPRPGDRLHHRQSSLTMHETRPGMRTTTELTPGGSPCRRNAGRRCRGRSWISPSRANSRPGRVQIQARASSNLRRIGELSVLDLRERSTWRRRSRAPSTSRAALQP